MKSIEMSSSQSSFAGSTFSDLPDVFFAIRHLRLRPTCNGIKDPRYPNKNGEIWDVFISFDVVVRAR
jgi:hypothetical protein